MGTSHIGICVLASVWVADLMTILMSYSCCWRVVMQAQRCVCVMCMYVCLVETGCLVPVEGLPVEGASCGSARARASAGRTSSLRRAEMDPGRSAGASGIRTSSWIGTSNSHPESSKLRTKRQRPEGGC